LKTDFGEYLFLFSYAWKFSGGSFMWIKKLQANGPEILNTDGGYTFLAKGVEIEGIAKLEGVVRIDGHFNGAINTNDMLIVGEHAVIRGSITADEIICSGRIEAKLTAQKKIQLLSTAVLIGDITTPAFSIEDGAFFHGMCDMGVSRRIECLTKESPAMEKVHDLIEHRELIPAH
jgi:cytoskeletal protein CcmA (bactofilin family)